MNDRPGCRRRFAQVIEPETDMKLPSAGFVSLLDLGGIAASLRPPPPPPPTALADVAGDAAAAAAAAAAPAPDPGTEPRALVPLLPLKWLLLAARLELRRLCRMFAMQ